MPFFIDIHEVEKLADFKYNRVLIALILVGLLAASLIAWQRHAVEENSSRVELTIDYEDITELALTEGMPVTNLMQQYKQAGITTLTIYETTLEKLHKSGKLTVVAGAELLASFRTGELNNPPFRIDSPEALSAQKIYIFANAEQGGKNAVFDEVKEDLNRRLGAGRVKQLPGIGSQLVLAVDASYEKAVKWNLGLPKQEIADAGAQGFQVIVRPSNYTKVTPDDVNAVFDRLREFNNITGIMFVGEEVLGYPDLVPLTAARMKERSFTLGMIEHPLQLQFVKQDGLMQLAALNNYQAARVYVIPKDEQPKLKVAEAIHRWMLTDQERNIRINLLRKYDKPEPYKTIVETNLAYIAGVKQSLAEKGFSFGRASAFQPYFPSPLLLAAVTLGATAAGVLLLSLLWPLRPLHQYILLALIAAALMLPILTGSGNLVRQMVALASAILFPVLAMTWQLDRWRRREPYAGSSIGRILADGVGNLALTALLSMIGGIYIAAILGDVRFFLEMEIYRGVKLTFIGPLVIMAMVYLTRFNIFEQVPVRTPKELWQQILRILNYPVSIKTMIGFGFVALAAWVFIGRSGHTAGVPVPAIELKLRAFLEQNMYARPREKEFLIGHPAFMLAVMAFYRHWPRLLHFALVIAATIAMGSLVETFAHLRTPVFMSIVRGLDGLLVGAVIGTIAVLGMQILHYLTLVLERRTNIHE